MALRKYTKDHEWVDLEGNLATVGITDFAQNALGDIVYVELPKVGQELTQGKEAAVVESVKAASDVYAPLSGVVTRVNDKLSADPALANQSPEAEGWFFEMKLSAPDEMTSLMDHMAYSDLTHNGR